MAAFAAPGGSIRPTIRTQRSIRMRSPPTISMCCASHAAPGRGKWKCGPGLKSSREHRPTAPAAEADRSIFQYCPLIGVDEINRGRRRQVIAIPVHRSAIAAWNKQITSGVVAKRRLRRDKGRAGRQERSLKPSFDVESAPHDERLVVPNLLRGPAQEPGKGAVDPA